MLFQAVTLFKVHQTVHVQSTYITGVCRVLSLHLCVGHEFLKILPSSHSSATWCIMVNVSMWCLLLSIRSGVLDIAIGIIKKVSHFNGITYSFHNTMYTHIFHKPIYQVFQNKSTISFPGGNYTANLYLFLAIYPLYHEENSKKIESQFQCF